LHSKFVQYGGEINMVTKKEFSWEIFTEDFYVPSGKYGLQL